VLSITTSSTSSSLSHAARARQSRRNSPNTRVWRCIESSGCSIKTVTTCSMRCTSMPATRRYKARNPRSSMAVLLWLKCQMAHRAITVSAECKMQSTEGWKTPRIELDSGLFTVRAATRPKGMGRAARQSGVRASPVQVRLGVGVGPSLLMRPQSPRVPSPILRPSGAFMLGGDGSKS
jgi:hypothetical protein